MPTVGVSVAGAKGHYWPLLEGGREVDRRQHADKQKKPEPRQCLWHSQERQPGAGLLPDPCLSWHCPWEYRETFQELAASLPGPGRWVLWVGTPVA